MSRGVGCRRGSDLALLWLRLWCRLAAIAPIRSLAWEHPYAAGAALEETIIIIIIIIIITQSIARFFPLLFPPKVLKDICSVEKSLG